MSRHGFTLIEVTIAVLVIGLAASTAVPPLMDWQRTMELTSSADRFERMHELTRVTAVREGRVAELHLDDAAGSMWIEVDTTGAGAVDTVAMVVGLADGVTFGSDRALLCFDGRGLPTSTGACESPNATVAFASTLSPAVDTTRVTLLGKVIR